MESNGIMSIGLANKCSHGALRALGFECELKETCQVHLAKGERDQLMHVFL